MSIALYPGTFDPITYGHLDIIRQALTIFDRVVVTVAQNPRKEPLFTVEERMEMIRHATADLGVVSVNQYDGLSVEAARQYGAIALIRGLRALSDFEAEFQMTLMNRQLAPEIETVFLMPSEPYTYLSSSIVKEVARFGGDVNQFVPPIVSERLRQKFQR